MTGLSGTAYSKRQSHISYRRGKYAKFWACEIQGGCLSEDFAR
jgi:hypothetical protein